MLHILRSAAFLMIALAPGVESLAMAQPQGGPGPAGEDLGDAEPGANDADKPWAAGVSAERQREAQALFAEGNELLRELELDGALARYEAALELWDHPAIRYRATLALFYLGRPVDAYKSLEKALGFGAAPLGATVHAKALEYRTRLEQQLGRLEIRCGQDGVAITLDGRPLSAIPASEVVLAGSHLVVARKEGYEAETIPVTIPPGKRARIDVELVPLRRADRGGLWAGNEKAWISLGAGVALAGGGVALRVRSASDFDEFDIRYSALPECSGGCTDDELPGDVADLLNRAVWESRVGVSALVIGSALAITGVTLLVTNQLQPNDDRSASRVDIAFTPVLAPDHAGVSARLRF